MTVDVIQQISLLKSLAPEWPDELLPGIQQEIENSRYKIVILDDDPTGTQTGRDLPVLTHWSVETLVEELLGKYPAFFILTNSRSLPGAEACELAREIGENLIKASELTGVRIVPISRGDSTLRGHFPGEVDSMAKAMGKSKLPYLILPFFQEGGRYTINDIHYVREGEQLIPAAMTPFAADAAFGFSKSNLKEWIEEKSAGRVQASEVFSISIDDIRKGGPARVADILNSVPLEAACIANIASYRDMEVLVSALIQIEKQGKEFLYRTAASFVRTRTGLDENNPLLTKNELTRTSSCGGLFVIGSYVEKTSFQVQALLEQTDILGIEVMVEALLSPAHKAGEISRVVALCSGGLKKGRDCAIYTSRNVVIGENVESSLDIGRIISNSLIEIVTLIDLQPRYLVAKGGITSSDVATKGLGVRRAMVLGQPLPGVPAWKLGSETRFPGMSYIVFPGNVGDNDALVQLKESLQ